MENKYRWLGGRAIWQRWYHRAGCEGCLTKSKECRDVFDQAALCKDATAHLSGFWCSSFCIISPTDDRIARSAILRHCLPPQNYGYFVLSEFAVARCFASRQVKWKTEKSQMLIHTSAGTKNNVMSPRVSLSRGQIRSVVMWCYYGSWYVKLCRVMLLWVCFIKRGHFLMVVSCSAVLCCAMSCYLASSYATDSGPYRVVFCCVELYVVICVMVCFWLWVIQCSVLMCFVLHNVILLYHYYRLDTCVILYDMA